MEADTSTLPRDEYHQHPYVLMMSRKDGRDTVKYRPSGVHVDPIAGSVWLEHGVYKGLQRQFWCLRDEQPWTEPGGTFPAAQWVPRRFTLLEGVMGLGVALEEDQVTLVLDAGTYILEASCPALDVGTHQIRLFNLTDQLAEAVGTSSCSHSDEQQTRSEVACHLTVTGVRKQFQIQHRCSGGRPTDGLGKSTGLAGSCNVYSLAKIQKVA